MILSRFASGCDLYSSDTSHCQSRALGVLPSSEREVCSSIFGFTEKLTLCSYVPKKGRAVILLSSMHHDARISDGEQRKPTLILDYNANKGAVDTIDMTTNTYSCNRQTHKYPTKLFTNMLNVACWNSFVIWMINNPEWNRGNLAKRRLFLKELAETLMKPFIRRRSLQPRLPASVRAAMELCGVKSLQGDMYPQAISGNQADRFVYNEHSAKGSLCLSHDISD